MFSKTKKYLFLVITVFLYSCTYNTTSWYAKDAPPEQMKEDLLQCRKQVSLMMPDDSMRPSDLAPSTTIMSSKSDPLRNYEQMKRSELYHDKVDQCMMERGYRKKTL